jgi:hypothetical protein
MARTGWLSSVGVQLVWYTARCSAGGAPPWWW